MLAIVGASFADRDGDENPGLVDRGLPILRAPGGFLPDLRARALAAALSVIDMPSFGQQTNEYEDFRARVGQTATAELHYLGVLVHGPKRGQQAHRQPRAAALSATGASPRARARRPASAARR